MTEGAAAQLSAIAFSLFSVTTAPFTVMRMNGLWWYPPSRTARVFREKTRPVREIYKKWIGFESPDNVTELQVGVA